jgi:hypothetical protein
VNVSVKLSGLDRIGKSLKTLANALATPVAEAAADALTNTLRRSRKIAGLDAPLDRTGEGARQIVGASDPESVVREFGALEIEATPWLAPSLPAAQGPMRAAIATAAARAISSLRAKNG